MVLMVTVNRMRVERASVLLSNSGLKVTEKHYSPWVRDRQEQLVVLFISIAIL